MPDRRPPARAAAFTLVEVMMASIILVVGFFGMIEAVTLCSNMTGNARRQTLADQIIRQEIEKLRLASWTTIAALPIANTDVPIDPQFSLAMAKSGATYSLVRSLTNPDRSQANPDPTTNLREVKFTVTWVVTSSRQDDAGNTLSFTYNRSAWAYFGRYGLNLNYPRS